MPSTRLWTTTPVALAAATLCLPSVWAQCAGVSVAPDAVAAQVVALSGQGQTRPPGEGPWSPAALAQQLGAGAGVRTLELSSAALLLADRTQIRMSANAQLRLCASQPERTLLELAAGRLWARTKKTPASLQLQTPAALAVVRGTDWDVEVDGAGRTTLTVLSGQVDLSNDLGRVELGPSEQGYVEPGKAPVKRLLVRPRERVQWVMANPVDATRWAELRGPEVAPPLAAVREDLRAGQWPRARERLLALSASGQGGAVAELLLADLDVFDDRMDAAQQRLATAWQRTQDPRTAARRAELLMALDQGAQARTWLDAARAQAPEATALLLADADWHRLEGRGEEAIGLYRRAVAGAEARREPAADQAAAQWGLGRALRERGDLHGARLALARAVALAPEHPAYQGEQATLAAEALRLGDAHTGFGAALAQAGDDYVSLAGAGLLALKRGDAPAARTQLLKALVIEPRYATAHLWLAVAEYQLGERLAAFDSLARARQADPNDPLPWQVESILRNDIGEPEAAIAAAREALARLPYLKSLNPLASDSLGSANLGKSLGDFGMEHWARAYAQQSYYPLWAGSHFFMANRYESSFSRNSEFHQGYLADPLAFGTSEKRAPVLLATGSEWLAGGSAERNGGYNIGVLDIGHRGLTDAPWPMAWRLGVETQQHEPRSGTGNSRLSTLGARVGVGVRPTDRLGLLFQHFQDSGRASYPGGFVDSDGVRLEGDIRQPTQRTELGAAWRWSADEQTWWSVHRGRYSDRLTATDPLAGRYDDTNRNSDQGVMLRHTLQMGSVRLSAGWELSRVQQRARRAYSLITGAEDTHLRFDVPWLGLEGSHGPWAWQAQAFWPQFDMRYRYRTLLGNTDENLRDPYEDRGGHARRLRPRLGLSYRFAPGRALHAAYIESMQAAATHTLAPVAVGAVPIDYQFQMPGSLARKIALQLDWEIDARSFGAVSLSRQEITNAMYSDGSLLPFLPELQDDKVASLGPLIQTAETSVEAYNGTPEFDRGRIKRLGLAYNRILAPRWSTLAAYTWTGTRNTGGWVPGNALPGFPRHTLVLMSVWRHGGRDYTYASLVYRSARFTSMLNGRREDPGWNLALAHSLDSADRRWSLIGTAQTPLDGRVKPTFWLRVRWRD